MDKQKVLALQTKEKGAQIGAMVFTSLSEKDKAEMYLHPAGIHVTVKGVQVLIPYGNIASARLEAPVAKPPEKAR